MRRNCNRCTNQLFRRQQAPLGSDRAAGMSIGKGANFFAAGFSDAGNFKGDRKD
jgi:hypothetical protein